MKRTGALILFSLIGGLWRGAPPAQAASGLNLCTAPSNDPVASHLSFGCTWDEFNKQSADLGLGSPALGGAPDQAAAAVGCQFGPNDPCKNYGLTPEEKAQTQGTPLPNGWHWAKLSPDPKNLYICNGNDCHLTKADLDRCVNGGSCDGIPADVRQAAQAQKDLNKANETMFGSGNGSNPSGAPPPPGATNVADKEPAGAWSTGGSNASSTAADAPANGYQNEVASMESYSDSDGNGQFHGLTGESLSPSGRQTNGPGTNGIAASPATPPTNPTADNPGPGETDSAAGPLKVTGGFKVWKRSIPKANTLIEDTKERLRRQQQDAEKEGAYNTNPAVPVSDLLITPNPPSKHSP